MASCYIGLCYWNAQITGYKFLVLRKGPFINYVCTKGGKGVNWVQTIANQGGGGCLGAANVCKKTIKSQLSLKDFPEIVYVCRNYCCMKFSHAAVLGIKSVRSTLVAFSTMYSYGEKKYVQGYFTDYYHSKGGGGLLVANLII